MILENSEANSAETPSRSPYTVTSLPADDDELLAIIKNPSNSRTLIEAAVAKLWKKYYPKISYLVNSKLRNALTGQPYEDNEDLIADIMTKIFTVDGLRYWDRSKGLFHVYINKIAVNKINDAMRAGYRRAAQPSSGREDEVTVQQSPDSDETHIDFVDIFTPRPGQSMIDADTRREYKKFFMKVMSKLDTILKPHEVVAIKSLIAGKSIAEISNQLGMTYTGTTGMISSIRRKLAEYFKSDRNKLKMYSESVILAAIDYYLNLFM